MIAPQPHTGGLSAPTLVAGLLAVAAVAAAVTDGSVIAAQLGQVPPGPDEGFLDDVIGARRIWTEPPDVAVQGLGMLGGQLADRGIGVAGEIAAGSVPR